MPPPPLAKILPMENTNIYAFCLPPRPQMQTKVVKVLFWKLPWDSHEKWSSHHPVFLLYPCRCNFVLTTTFCDVGTLQHDVMIVSFAWKSCCRLWWQMVTKRLLSELTTQVTEILKSYLGSWHNHMRYKFGTTCISREFGNQVLHTFIIKPA